MKTIGRPGRVRNGLLVSSLLLVAAWLGPRAGAGAVAPLVVPADQAAAHVGETVTVEGKVTGARYLERSVRKLTFLNFGEPYPKHCLTVMIDGKDRGKFPAPPEEAYKDKTVRVTGKVIDYRGKPEIVVTEPAQIEIVPE